MSRRIQVIKEYLHLNNDEYSDLWPYDAPQQRSFNYRLYEVEFNLEVDMDTGETRIVAVDGVPCDGRWPKEKP